MIIRRPIHINVTSAILLIVLNGVHYSNMGLLYKISMIDYDDDNKNIALFQL